MVMAQMNRCKFDPRSIPTTCIERLDCPECGMSVMSGAAHPVDFDEGIEQAHNISEWVEEHKEDLDD